MNSAFGYGIAYGLFMAISVGPSIFAIIRNSISYGWKAGAAFVVGVSLSDTLFVVVSNIAGEYLSKLMVHKQLMGIIGASIIILMGTYGMLKKIKVSRPSSNTIDITGKDYFKIMMSGFALNTFNPSLLLTWITFVTNVIVVNPNTSYRIVVFATCLTLIISIDLLKILLAEKLRTRLTPRNIVYVNRFSALCLIATGVYVLINLFFTS
jgi:threonine/homoserine/homoserine lactone efflux protein